MPGSQSKITFDAINIVRAENIYLSESKHDQNTKRKKTTTVESIHQKKKVISDLNLGTLNPRTSAKHKKCVNPKINFDIKSKNTSSGVTNAKLSRKKRQRDIGNAYSKLNSQVKTLPKPFEGTKAALSERSDSRSSFYLTPRQNFPISEIDFENINPNRLPENFYECELDEFIRSQYPDFENSPENDFKPLNFENLDLPPESFHPKNSSLKHFKELLEQEKSSKNKLLDKSEIELLKDIVKADERYQKLKKDDYQLLKEILLGQLKEISEQERVIKIALEKIRSNRQDEVEVDSLKVAKAEQPLEKNLNCLNSEKVLLTDCDVTKIKTEKSSPAKQEVEIYFKNIPSLEKEIRILKFLGLKLEETLKNSHDKTIIKPPLILFAIQAVSFKHSINITSSTMLPFGTKTVLGFVQEFKISHQTINELKMERDFYIATDWDNLTLQRTSFDLLRNNPEMLLRRLKPFTKDSRMKFNIIEQDPLFFNHFLANICKMSSKSYATHETFIPKNDELANQKPKMIPALVMSGAGDHCDFICKEEITPKLELPVVVEKSIRTTIERKTNKHARTPLKETKFVSPKNSLLKIILLGSLNLTIALMVFTAILYPDVFCI